MENVVTARALTKRFGELVAVDGISFEMRRGECFGFLGPNGAGKTSTMRMMQAVSPPSGGTLTVLGLDPVRDGARLRARVGVVPQENNLDPDLTVEQNLFVYARYYGIKIPDARRRSAELLEFMQLGEKAKEKVPALSGGMKRRLIVARSLLHSPELLILDEPTTGLDPQARHLIWQKLRALKAGGTTMALTTHYMEEAAQLCDRLVILDRGRVLAEGAPAELVARHVGREVVEVRAAHGQALDAFRVDGAAPEKAGDTLFFFFPERADEKVVAAAREKQLVCMVRHATLEDVFLKLTGRELKE